MESGFGLCLFLVYADVLLCSASIVHMSVISLDRYLGISRPLRLRNNTSRTVFTKIVVVWVLLLPPRLPHHSTRLTLSFGSGHSRCYLLSYRGPRRLRTDQHLQPR